VFTGHTGSLSTSFAGSLSTSFAHFFYLNRTSHIPYAASHLQHAPQPVDECRARLSTAGGSTER